MQQKNETHYGYYTYDVNFKILKSLDFLSPIVTRKKVQFFSMTGSMLNRPRYCLVRINAQLRCLSGGFLLLLKREANF